jgi:LacI family transcriptional regulator
MNLEEIGRLAGVSRSTVSRVVNGDRRVSAAVRQRVEELIRAHHYHPHAAARSLASQRTRLIGLLIPNAVGTLFHDPFYPLLIQGICDECNTADYAVTLLLEDSTQGLASHRIYERMIHGRHVDGIIIAGQVVEDPIVARLQADGFPFVLVGRHPQHQVSWVDIANRDGARLAVAHLLDHGRRRIAMIAGPPSLVASIDRYAGYVTALGDAGRLPEPGLTIAGDFTRAGGYRAMQELLAHPGGRPDAVFVASDAMAAGALQALGEGGVVVPDEVAVMGFDGFEATLLALPSLSAVVQPVEEEGRVAVQTLLEVIEHPTRAPIQRLLPIQLWLSRSCGCPAATSLAAEGGTPHGADTGPGG